MTFKERAMQWLGLSDPPIPPEAAALDVEHNRISERLSKMTPLNRDGVLREAYRKADDILASKR